MDIRHPPKEFDALIDWFESVSSGLVTSEEYLLSDVRDAIGQLETAVKAHRKADLVWVERDPPKVPELYDLARALRADHEMFATSLEQLWWFFRIVEKEDHGGHRQALGQYGRVVCEALRRHRLDEREYVRRSAIFPVSLSSSSASGKHN